MQPACIMMVSYLYASNSYHRFVSMLNLSALPVTYDFDHKKDFSTMSKQVLQERHEHVKGN